MRSEGNVRTFVERHPALVDVTLTLGLFAIACADLVVNDRSAPHRGQSTILIWSALLTLPLLWRRRAPIPVFAILALAALGEWFTTRPMWADLSLLVALYTVAALRSRAWTAATAATLELGVVLAVARWAGGGLLSVLVFLSGMVIAAVALGRSVQIRRAYLVGLEDRAARLEYERDQQGQIAAAAERARIAREMHDIVAHNLSVMTSLADGAAFAARSDPEQATRAMELSASTGRQALADMRRLLGVLREDAGAERAPQPGTDDVPQLLDQVRAAGLPVTLAVSGDPPALPPAAQLTIFRLIQEALTNTLKHGGAGATAAVAVRYDAAGVELNVSDTGSGAAGGATAGAGGGGQGLEGMRERAAVYAGAVEAGPRPEGGWRVRARLEIPGAAAARESPREGAVAEGPRQAAPAKAPRAGAPA